MVQSGTVTQSTATPPVSKQGTVISVQLQDVPVAEALQYVSNLSGIKVRYAALAKDDSRVTMSLKDIPAEVCFRYIANLANLTVAFDAGWAIFEPKK